MQDLQTDWLKCFVAAVDAGSLSSAAPEIHRSQSAVSMQIKKLESAVGCPLLIRGPRQLQLTPEGQVLLGYARRLLDLHAEAQAALQGEAVSGLVRLGVPDDYASKYLTPVLKRFAPRHGTPGPGKAAARLLVELDRWSDGCALTSTPAHQLLASGLRAPRPGRRSARCAPPTPARWCCAAPPASGSARASTACPVRRRRAPPWHTASMPASAARIGSRSRPGARQRSSASSSSKRARR